MEMEHINDDLIKVFITLADLEDRGIDFLDLIDNQGEVEKFFHSILEEVDINRHFQSSEAVTFQVMPKTDGLELYISRSNGDDLNDFWTDEISRLIQSDQARERQEKKTPSVDEVIFDAPPPDTDRVLVFQELNDFLHLAREFPTDLLETDLYEKAGQYYLVIGELCGTMMSEQARMTYLQMLEYGQETSVTSAMLKEHGNLLYGDHALKYFGENF